MKYQYLIPIYQQAHKSLALCGWQLGTGSIRSSRAAERGQTRSRGRIKQSLSVGLGQRARGATPGATTAMAGLWQLAMGCAEETFPPLIGQRGARPLESPWPSRRRERGRMSANAVQRAASQDALVLGDLVADEIERIRSRTSCLAHEVKRGLGRGRPRA